MIELKNDYVLKDMIICALRYSLGRRTYVTEETATFIKENPKLIDERVKSVMLRDLNEYFDKRTNSYHFDDECDYKVWLSLKKWLEEMNV